jgi:hypothetical protein
LKARIRYQQSQKTDIYQPMESPDPAAIASAAKRDANFGNRRLTFNVGESVIGQLIFKPSPHTGDRRV